MNPIDVTTTDPDGVPDWDARAVGVLIRARDGRQINAVQCFPPDAAEGTLVQGILACARSAAAHDSALLGTMLDDAVSLGSTTGNGLTVAALDQLAQQATAAVGGSAAFAVQVPGWDEPIPYLMARAVLAAADAW